MSTHSFLFINLFFDFSENPEKWMQKFENVNIEKIKLIQPILWKQGFCIEVEDRTSSGDNMKYVMLLHDDERTNSFLSFIRGYKYPTLCVSFLYNSVIIFFKT